MKVLVLCLVCLIGLPVASFASPGDSDPAYQTCLSDCIRRDECIAIDQGEAPLLSVSYHARRSLFHRLFYWSCTDHCRYDCMHSIVSLNLEQGLPIEQYYGKWPFIQVLGMQEIVSVLFSLLNLHAHYCGYLKLKRLSKETPMRDYYLFASYLAMATWSFSALFHARDKPWTERLDYAGAIATIAYGTTYAFIRYCYRHSFRCNVLLGLGLIYYLIHQWIANRDTRFNYSFNMASGAVLALLFNISWLLFYFNERKVASRQHYIHRLPVAVVWMVLAMSLEALEFVPLGLLVDAHSLWHGATWPWAWYWYGILLADARCEREKMSLIYKHA